MNGDANGNGPPNGGGPGLALPAFLTNPIALLRVALGFFLVLGLLGAIPSLDAGNANMLDVIAGGLFRTLFVLSVLFLTLLLLDRPATEQREPGAGVIDTIVSTLTGWRDTLPVGVLGLGLLVALLGIPARSLTDNFLGWVESLAFQLSLTVAFTVLVAALLGMVRAREGATGGNALQPNTPEESAAILRDGTVVAGLLLVATMLLDILGEIDDVFGGITQFGDTFEFTLWYLMALVTIEVVLLGLAWAIERRRGIEDPAAATRLASNVPMSLTPFWDASALLRMVTVPFFVLAAAYAILNFVAWGGLESNSSDGLGSFGVDGLFHLAVFGSDLLWTAMFGGVILAVAAGIGVMTGQDDVVPDISVQAMYAIGGLGSLVAILSFVSEGDGYGFYDAFFNTLIYRWGLAGCAIAGLIAMRALYWDRTIEPL